MSGTARRTKELAESFVKMGHYVTVITSYPRNYRSFPGENFKPYEKISGVNVFRVKNLFEVNKNPFFRMISYLLFVISTLSLGLKLSKDSNIIISVAPLSSGIVGAIIQKLTNKHHHFDVPDILPDLGIAAGMIKNRVLIYYLRKLELWVYNNSNSISTCTEGQRRNIYIKGIPKEKLYYIPDWIDKDYFSINQKKYFDQVSNYFRYKNKKIVSFVGNIGVLQNPSIFIELMLLLKKNGRDDFVLFFIGDGIMLEKMKKLSLKYKLDNIEFIGRVKREYIPAMMNKSDVLITNYISHEHLDLYIPGKLFEYAISSKPILIGAKGDAKHFINKYNLGLTVEPSDVVGFKNALLKIVDGLYDYNPSILQFTNDYSINYVTSKYRQIFDIYIK